MKNQKYNSQRRKLVKDIICFALIQALIFVLFQLSFCSSSPVDIEDTMHVKVTVEQKELIAGGPRGETVLWIFCDGVRYIFLSRTLNVREIYDKISIGDELALTYKQEIFKKIVVEAYSEDEVYCRLDDFNNAKQNATLGVIILFSVLELVFLIIVYSLFSSSITNKKRKHNQKKNKIYKSS